jgi:putative NADH-flavin reductase
MKIAIYGASGMIGQRIAAEALARGHQVTGVVRHPARLAVTDQRFTAVKGSALDPAGVAATVAGHDAVVSAIGPAQEDDPAMLVEAARALTDGLARAGVPRLIVIGGAGSLEVAPGVQLVDTPEFPAAWRPTALAQRDALDTYRRVADLDWTYISPAAMIAPGERTGRFRIGGDSLLVDAEGQSRISAEDCAVALLDELEKPQHIRQRITVAY